MSEVTIRGRVYRFGKMDPKTQFHVARRLGPIIGALASQAGEGQFAPITTDEGGGNPLMNSLSADPAKALAGLSDVLEQLANLDDAPLDYIFEKTLAVTERKNGENWAKVAASNGSLMFEDIDMRAMLELAWGAIQANLKDFFSENP